MRLEHVALGLGVGVLIMAGPVSAVEDGEAADRAVMVMFSSEPMDPSTGIKVTQYFVADDFEVASSGDATTISFKLGDWIGDFPVVFDGLIRWSIHFDSGFRADHNSEMGWPSKAEQRVGGEPGVLLARGTAVDVAYSIVTPASPIYTAYYHVAFNLGQQVALAAGTRYWLVLNVNRGQVDEELHSWVASDLSSYAKACFMADTPTWTSSTIDLTFSVIANSDVRYLFADGFETGDVTIWSSSLP